LREQWIPAGFIREIRTSWSGDPVNAKWNHKAKDIVRLDVEDEKKTALVARRQCKCHHTAAWMFEEIKERWVHEYRKSEDTGEQVLVCLTCFDLWDHRATDRLMRFIRETMATVAATKAKGKKQASR
jgi:hypothetical protein